VFVARLGKNLPWVAALGIALFSTKVFAFCRTTTCDDPCEFDLDTGCAIGGIPIAWPTRCISYSVQTDVPSSIGLEAATVAIDSAFLTWQTAACIGTGAPPTISVSNAFGPATCNHVEYNRAQGNANVIMFRDESWDYVDASKALALTTVTFNVKTGDIYDADMEINTPLLGTSLPGLGGGAYDLQAVVTHETGHFLGLAHSEQAGATMLYTYGPRMRSLADDDVAGICAIYPPARPAGVCDPTPRQGFSAQCAMDPTAGSGCSMGRRRPATPAAAAILALGAMLVWRRRRSAP
jgi:hypothetical protein